MNEDYYIYLTQRLDKGKSKNPVVQEAEKRIREILKRKSIVRIADIGCFSGSVINRVYENLPIKLRNQVRLVGIDNNREALAKGKKNYPAITFVVGNLLNEVPLIRQYQVVILSNVLHEVYSSNGSKVVKSIIHNVIKLLNKSGYLIILDGIKPAFSSKKITVEFANDSSFEKFFNFAKSYKALPIKAKKISSKEVKTDIGSLAAFMTKARYLDESFWKQESLELYQSFTARDFEKMLAVENVKIVKFELQHFSKAEIGDQIRSIKPRVKVPAKNVLIVAKRI